MAEKNKADEQAPESAADVVKDVQKEIGKTGDLNEAPVTPELLDAKNRLVEAARDARTRAQAEYPYMMYDQEDAARAPRIVHNDEEYNAAKEDGYDDAPAKATEHGRGDNAEERQVRDLAERQARVELEKDALKAKMEAERDGAETERGGKRGKK